MLLILTEFFDVTALNTLVEPPQINKIFKFSFTIKLFLNFTTRWRC